MARDRDQRFGYRRVVRQLQTDHDLGRHRLPRVVLQQEFGERVRRLAHRRRKEIRGAEAPPLAHRQQRHGVLPRLALHRHNIDVAGTWCIRDLLGLQFGQTCQLVAQPRSGLELQAIGRRRHACAQLLVQRFAVAFQYPERRVEILAVVGSTDQSDAGRRAAADLMLQAGAGAMREKTVAAIADAEHFLQLLQHLFDDLRVRERAEQPARGPA